MLDVGRKLDITFTVDLSVTAKTVGSGTLEVLATPVMIARLEQAAWQAVAPELEEGSSTVGTYMEIKHLSPSPLGMEVVCSAELVKIEGRLLHFHLTARDQQGIIGEGVHTRAIVQSAKFLAKAVKKLSENEG